MWHQVRFVSDAVPPCSEHRPLIRQQWEDLRGTPVRIGRLVTRQEVEDALHEVGALDRMCECCQFFELHPDEFEALVPEMLATVCRAMLEMD